MDSPYHELKHLRQSYSNGDIDGDAFEREIRVILKNDGIAIRPETKAKLGEINTSIPTTEADTLMLGLRYLKEQDDYSEDLFLFRDESYSIDKGYRGIFEKTLPEYQGTHKQPPHVHPVPDRFSTQVNTICIGRACGHKPA